MPSCVPTTFPSTSTISPVLALLGLGGRKPGLAGELAHLGLRHPAEREHRARKLGLREREEIVRLVLRRVKPAPEFHATPVALDPGVMPRRQELPALAAGLFEQPAELDLGVAHGARVRRPPAQVFRADVVDEEREILREVEDRERDAQAFRDPPGPVGRLRRRRAANGPPRHERPRDVVPLLQQAPRRRGAVHAAAHRDQDAPFLAQVPSPPGRHYSRKMGTVPQVLCP